MWDPYASALKKGASIADQFWIGELKNVSILNIVEIYVFLVMIQGLFPLYRQTDPPLEFCTDLPDDRARSTDQESPRF